MKEDSDQEPCLPIKSLEWERLLELPRGVSEDNIRIQKLRDKFWNQLKDIEEIYLNGDLNNRIPGNLNVSFNYVEGESLIMAIKDIAVSSGSACASASLEGKDYVLRALGRDDELAHSSIRITIGKYTTEEEVDYAVDLLKNLLKNFVIYLLYGICTKMALILNQSNGMRISQMIV